jgi:hypothetical protein
MLRRAFVVGRGGRVDVGCSAAGCERARDLAGWPSHDSGAAGSRQPSTRLQQPKRSSTIVPTGHRPPSPRRRGLHNMNLANGCNGSSLLTDLKAVPIFRVSSSRKIK